MQLLSFNVTGDGTTKAIADIPGTPKQCKWFQFLDNANSLNIGGPAASVDATHGYPISATGANFQPPIAMDFTFYDLEAIFFYLGNADTAVLLCAV